MNISKMLREKAVNTTISPDELFGSKDFRDYFSRIAEGLTEKWGGAPRIQISDDGEHGPTAYTDGDIVHINRSNNLVETVKGLYKKFLVMMGIGFHELAHTIFLDFDENNRQMDKLEKGQLPGKGPFVGKAADEIRAALKSLTWQTFFASLYHKLSNFAADNHDEEAMITANKWASFHGRPSLVEQCILTTRQVLKGNATTVERMMENAKEHDAKLDLMLNMMFQYIRFGYLLVWDPQTLDTEEVKSLEPFKKNLDLISTTDDTIEKFDGITRIVLGLWPIIKEKVQNNDNDNDQSQQGTPQDGGKSDSGQSQSSQGGDSQDSEDNSDQNGSGLQGQPSSEKSKPSKADKQGSGQPQGSQQGSDDRQPGGSNPQNSQSDASGSKSQADTSEQQPSAPSLSSDSLDRLLDAMNNAAKGQGETTTPKNRSSSPATKEKQHQTAQSDDNAGVEHSDAANQGEETDAQQGDMGGDATGNDTSDDAGQTDPIKGEVHPKDGDGQSKGDSDDMSEEDASGQPGQDLQAILDRMKNAKAAEETEKEIDQARNVEVQTINAAGSHSKVSAKVERIGAPSEGAQARYNRVYTEVASYSKRLQRLVKQQFEDLVMGQHIRHRDFGRNFDVRDAYRPDQKFFTIKKQPDDIPEIVVALLMDLSGSMCGARLDAAKKAAVMLNEFCVGLDIPCMVCGHRVSTYGRWDLVIASEFDSVTDQDKYRIMEMSAGGCNRDGAAIEVVQGLLAKRPEKNKLFFILSDGQPADVDYGGEKAANDIKGIVARYRRKGVTTFATAIGDDKDRIQDIYGEGYLDIDDLSKLPVSLTKLLKKVILTNI